MMKKLLWLLRANEMVQVPLLLRKKQKKTREVGEGGELLEMKPRLRQRIKM